MGPLTRAVQTGIGLAAELQAARKERRASGASADNGSTDQLPSQVDHLKINDNDNENDSSEDDEHFGGGGVSHPGESAGADFDAEPPPYTTEELSEPSDIKYPETTLHGTPPERLSCPVVIPQRRPGSKTRGLLRAYAPVLADYEIDQETFATFLKSFHKASQASPILSVITIGAAALGNIPEPFSQAAAIGLSVLSGTAQELQGRYRTNHYLDQANELLFKPRGLYSLVMCFRPDDVPKGEVALEPVDTSAVALKWLSPPTSSFRMYASNFRGFSGTTHGELEMPETAPLIYPDTGYVEIGKKKNDKHGDGSFSKRKVAAAYFDKRAQAKYAYKHPDSVLATENAPQFASKYGDPTHPSVTTNYYGHVAAALKKETIAERQARKREQALQARDQGGTVRRLLQRSVLYLMIVNFLPKRRCWRRKPPQKIARSPVSDSADRNV